MQNFTSGEEATDEKMRIILLVWQSYNNWVARSPQRGGFVPRQKPTQNAARLAFQSFSVKSPMCTGYRARNRVRCEEVVSLSYDKFSLTVSISNTLKLHIFCVGFLLCRRVSTVQTSISQYEVGLHHYSDTFVASISTHDQTL